MNDKWIETLIKFEITNDHKGTGYVWETNADFTNNAITLDSTTMHNLMVEMEILFE